MQLSPLGTGSIPQFGNGSGSAGSLLKRYPSSRTGSAMFTVPSPFASCASMHVVGCAEKICNTQSMIAGTLKPGDGCFIRPAYKVIHWKDGER